MAKINIDKEIKAKSIEKATEKFAKILREKNYKWVADEMTETVENGFFYCSNASEIDLIKGSSPISPKTRDWTYYWAIEEVNDDGKYYAWFIEKNA